MANINHLSRPRAILLLAVAVIAASALGFEMALMRVFAALLNYHFAFFVISVALLGLGIGGYVTHEWRRHRPVSLARLASVLSFAIDLGLVLVLRLLFPFAPAMYIAAGLFVLVPFMLVGIFLAEVMARFPQSSGCIYAWDLTGGAIAVVGSICLLNMMGPINMCLAIAVLPATVSIILARHETDQTSQHLISMKPTRPTKKIEKYFSLAALSGSLIILFLNCRTSFVDIPAIPPQSDSEGLSLADKGITSDLFTELSITGHSSKIIDTRWNAVARTDLVDDRPKTGAFLIYTNGNIPSELIQWDGNVKSIDQIARYYPLTDFTFASSALGIVDQKGNPIPHGSVMSIGPGGGLDALIAIRYGAERFDGAEVNPSVINLVHDYRSMDGFIYERPQIHIAAIDGRSFVREAQARHKHYSLLYSALTKSAAVSQGTILVESYIYTQDAFLDYWNIIDNDGQIAIVTDSPDLLARLFVTAVSCLNNLGINSKDACNRIVLLHVPEDVKGPYRYAIWVRKMPITSSQAEQISRDAAARRITLMWSPGQGESLNIGPYVAVGRGSMSLSQFVDWWHDPANIRQLGANHLIDVTPCDDNRPFFYDMSLNRDPMYIELSLSILVMILLLTIVKWMSMDTAPTTRTIRTSRARLSFPCYCLFTFYFAALGIGFMQIEMPLAQRLILPLGYPSLAMAVILFSIMLGSGLGAWFSQRISDLILKRWTIVCMLSVALLAVSVWFALDKLQGLLLSASIPMRCVIVSAMLLPLGFFLGTPLPGGIRLFAKINSRNIPLLWGVNGLASVVGSLIAVSIARDWGFNVVLALGSMVYISSAILLAMATSMRVNASSV